MLLTEVSSKMLGTFLMLAISATALQLDISDSDSIRQAARTIADGAMVYYKGNITGDPVKIGDLQDPYYWWQAGALWGAMLDYYHYTKDPSYNPVVIEALTAPANTGPQHDFNPPEHFLELGNDDLSFWGFAVLSAAERNFPQPQPEVPSWLQMGRNICNTLISRWDETNCGGGVHWQVFESNYHGKDYKNTVTNGGLFQLSARLARATGEQTYADWAAKVWDWSVAKGFIGKKMNVYDGAQASQECAKINHVSFSYTAGIYLYGAAVMAEHTGDQVWADRAQSLLQRIEEFFFGESQATKNIMYEPACEPTDQCNHDMKSLKGYLSRFMWQSVFHLPALEPIVKKLLQASSMAAAQSCSGGSNGVTCGQKWYKNGFDGSTGLGQQMCALETIQGLLVDDAQAPLQGNSIRTVRELNWNDQPSPGDGSVGKGIDNGKPSTVGRSVGTHETTPEPRPNDASPPYSRALDRLMRPRDPTSRKEEAGATQDHGDTRLVLNPTDSVVSADRDGDGEGNGGTPDDLDVEEGAAMRINLSGWGKMMVTLSLLAAWNVAVM